jgi:hypothetical protein
LKLTSAAALVYLLAFSASNLFAGLIVNLGAADPYAVLGGSAKTNTGPTTIHGDLGIWPGTSITGFPPGVVTGTIHDSDANAMNAQNSLVTAYNFAAGQPCASVLTGQNLGGLTLIPGVYCFASSAQLTGTLTLNANGDPNALFLFQIGSTLTTANNSAVVFTNGGQGDNVFWQVGSSATFGTTTNFAGNVLAQTTITFNTGANLSCGRALAINGAVTTDTNNISIDTPGCEATTSGSATPEPGTAGLLVVGVLFSGMVNFTSRRRNLILAAQGRK